MEPRLWVDLRKRSVGI